MTDNILDPLSLAECDSRLIILVLDLALMTLIPEMGNTMNAGMVEGPPPIISTNLGSRNQESHDRFLCG